MKNKEKLINSICISLAFVFNLLIFAPIEFYYLNIMDFWFPVKFVLPTIIITAIVAFGGITVLLYKLPDKKRFILSKIFFVLLVCLYLQGNFLNIGYQQLNGSEENWSAMIFKGVVNTLIWLGIILFFFALPLFKDEKIFEKVSNISSIIIFGIEIITLFVVVILYNSTTYAFNINKDYYLDESNIFNMSEDENIVFYMADSLEAKFMAEIFEENPEYKNIFSDFTFFDNTTGCSLLTFMSMPTMLTGEELVVGETLQKNINENLEKSNLYTELNNLGFETEWYTDLALVPTNTDNEIITNKVSKELKIDAKSKIKISSLLYECVLYKYTPHFVKPLFNIDATEFNNINSVNINPYFIDDAHLNEKLLEEGVQKTASNKRFKVIETNGVHNPFTLNANGEISTNEEYAELTIEEKQKEQLKGVLKIFENYINELKAEGVYDNSTIIFVADHGFENRYNPTLMVKRKQDKNDTLQINHAPISLIEDFIPTILNIASNSKNFGKDIYDYSEDEERIRKINNYYFARDEYKQIFVESNIVLSTDSKASDFESFKILDQVFPDIETLKEEYKFGKIINFSNGRNLKYVTTNGILHRDGDVTYKGATIGNKCTVKLKTPQTPNDIKALLVIKQAYSHQKITIKANDMVVYDNAVEESDNKINLEFNIPAEVWNSNELLNLEFEFPNAHTYSNEASSSRLGTDWVQRAFIFESIKFDN